jgi:intraflagellar transport protein 122
MKKREAYEVACLGITSKDWETLGFAALDVFQFDIARKAFIRTRDLKFLTLISFLQVPLRSRTN